MISAMLNGGLGNQMFQIAATYVLALENNDRCGFDFSKNPVGQGNSGQTYRNNIYKKLLEIPPKWEPWIHYQEPQYFYTPIKYKKNMYLKGYFSGDKYIGTHRQEILDLFLEDGIISNLKHGFRGILNNSVSMHVRRGDYINLPDVYIRLENDYYERALQIIKNKTRVDNILVFSDDIEWCRENLKMPDIYFSELLPDYGDLYLMSLCSHNIMANSSFSWWGSYLNKNPNKIVIAPEKWFTTEGSSPGRPEDATHVFCNNWIKI